MLFSMTPLSHILSFLLTSLFFLPCISASEWIDYPSDGYATMTHYTLPENFIAACGCTAASTDYPTAAMNQMAYGSDAFTANPRFYPSVTKSVVIKVTDLCPLSRSGWCNATTNGVNAGGHSLNFDLAWPSSSIPDDFFPSDEAFYGFTDFGVWNISYQSVSCTQWRGWNVAAALGSVASLGYSACCPDDPTGNANDTCTSYSDDNGIPPDTRTSGCILASPLLSHYIAIILGVSGFAKMF